MHGRVEIWWNLLSALTQKAICVGRMYRKTSTKHARAGGAKKSAKAVLETMEDLRDSFAEETRPTRPNMVEMRTPKAAALSVYRRLDENQTLMILFMYVSVKSDNALREF